MKYNHQKNTVISIDSGGMIEYWDATVKGDHDFPQVTSHTLFPYFVIEI